MSDRNLSLAADGGSDDLPRTLRREREARERAAQAATYSREPAWMDDTGPQPAVVTAIKMPFFRLMLFFLKAVLAAIPALILLGVVLWFAGHLLMSYFPWLVKVQILIRVPY